MVFPAEYLTAQYLEEQAAARQQRQAEDQAAAAAAAVARKTLSVPATSTSTPAATRPTTPANVSAQQKPTGLLLNFLQGFVTYNHQEPQCKSASSSPGSEKSELEALIAEKKRDVDIVSQPAVRVRTSD